MVLPDAATTGGHWGLEERDSIRSSQTQTDSESEADDDFVFSADDQEASRS